MAGHTVTGLDEYALALARYLGQRVAPYAAVVAAARRAVSWPRRPARPRLLFCR
jgi:hypothetical protein